LERRGSGKKKEDRKCSFCETRGHDRRTCERISTFIAVDSRKVLEARTLYKARAEEQGFGVGSLVQFETRMYDYKTSGYNTKNIVGIVNRISWDKADHRLQSNSQSNIVNVVYNDFSKNSDGQSATQKEKAIQMPLPYDIIHGEPREDDDNYYYRSIEPKLLGPVANSGIPKDFLSTKTVEKVSRNYTKDRDVWTYSISDALAEAAEKAPTVGK